MKTKEEIEQLAETYTNKIVEVAYHNFPLVPTKESVSKVITVLLVEYTNQCQEDMGKELEELKDWKRWFFEEQKRADDLKMELEYLKLTTKNK